MDQTDPSNPALDAEASTLESELTPPPMVIDAHTTAGGPPGRPINLRAQVSDAPIDPCDPRFHIFLLDTGWNAPVSKAVRRQLPLIHQYQDQDVLYILSHEQSVEALKNAPYLIGKDPTILVYDCFARDPEHHGNYRGFRLNLGLMRNPEQALARLQEFVRFVHEHRSARFLQRAVRREMHREGVEGAIKILGESLETGIEFV